MIVSASQLLLTQCIEFKIESPDFFGYKICSWAFVQRSGRLIGINDTVGIALDLDERRSITIPNSIREAISENNHLPARRLLVQHLNRSSMAVVMK
jgi:hypothetical protein